MTKKTLPAQSSKNLTLVTEGLLDDLRLMIDQTKANLATTVNMTLTMLNWRVGKRIREEVLLGERAEYGKQIVVSLSRQLVVDYGKSFEEKNLRRMVQFAEVFPSEEIVVSLIRQLSWSHFITDIEQFAKLIF